MKFVDAMENVRNNGTFGDSCRILIGDNLVCRFIDGIEAKVKDLMEDLSIDEFSNLIKGIKL